LLPWWLLWGAGVALVPLGGLLVPGDGNPFPLAVNLPVRTGLLLWIVWGAAFASMFAAMLGLRTVGARTVAAAQLCAGIFVATLTFAAPSPDPYTYVTYGEIDRGGHDPWRPYHATVVDDATRVAVHAWGNPVGAAPYGPLFILGERALLAVVPHDATRTLILVHRYVALLAAVGITLLVRGPRVAFWGLHPLVLFVFPVSGHNDALMLVLVALSLRVRSAFLAGIAIGAAGMVKIVGLGSLLFRPSKTIVVTFAGAGAAIAGFLALQPHAATLAPVIRVTEHRHFGGGSPAYLIEKVFDALHFAEPRYAALLVLLWLTLLCLYRVRKPWSRRDASLYAALIVVALSPFVFANYVCWVLFPALWASRAIRGVALTFSGAAWLYYLPEMPADRPHGVTVALWLPVAFACAYYFIAPRLREAQLRRTAIPESA
jgi:hypothetical protein